MMGIYIKGMEMPQGCFFCIFNKHLDPDTDMCLLTRDAFDSTFQVVEHRKDKCPLVPVPDHGDLIDRKDAYDEILAGMVITGYQSRALDCISEYRVPTVIPAEGLLNAIIAKEDD